MENAGTSSTSMEESFFDFMHAEHKPSSKVAGDGGATHSYKNPAAGPVFDFGNDDLLPSFEFQPAAEASKSSTTTTQVDDRARRTLSPSPLRPKWNNSSYDQSGHPGRESVEWATVVATVERTMKKYADNLLHVLEGMSGRLSQLEFNSQRIEHTVGKLKVESADNHGAADGKLRSLESMVREVQRGVQVLRDKQEIVEEQLNLAKLQLGSKMEAPVSSAVPVQAVVEVQSSAPKQVETTFILAPPSSGQQIDPAMYQLQQVQHQHQLQLQQQQLQTQHMSVSSTQQQIPQQQQPPLQTRTQQQNVVLTPQQQAHQQLLPQHSQQLHMRATPLTLQPEPHYQPQTLSQPPQSQPQQLAHQIHQQQAHQQLPPQHSQQLQPQATSQASLPEPQYQPQALLQPLQSQPQQLAHQIPQQQVNQQAQLPLQLHYQHLQQQSGQPEAQHQPQMQASHQPQLHLQHPPQSEIQYQQPQTQPQLQQQQLYGQQQSGVPSPMQQQYGSVQSDIPSYSPQPPGKYSSEKVPAYLPEGYGSRPLPQPVPQMQQHSPNLSSDQAYDPSHNNRGGQLALPPPYHPGHMSLPVYETYAPFGYRMPSTSTNPVAPNPGTGSYPRFPTDQPLTSNHNSNSASNMGSSSGTPPLATNRVTIDEVINKVASMGFSKDQVHVVIRKLTENGQSVDLNIVLDKLMNGGGDVGEPQPQKGWYNH